LKRLLQGQHGTYRDIVLFNAGAALVVAGRTDDLQKAVQLAGQAIDNGAARDTLEKLITITNKKSP
jgi:anthranilate phosphoribosyltransferase